MAAGWGRRARARRYWALAFLRSARVRMPWWWPRTMRAAMKCGRWVSTKCWRACGQYGTTDAA